MSIEIPVPHKVFDAEMEDGAIIRLRQHGNPAGPRIALSHGNGLAIDGYFPFWGPLRDHYELILFDFRNHGQNPLHTLEHHEWSNFVNDLERVFHFIQRKFGSKRTVGVFHSLSATTSAAHAQRMGIRWDPLVLFDPPLFPPEGHPLNSGHAAHQQQIGGRAARRTPRYKDPTDLARQFARHFPRWVPGAHELMARATLRRDQATGEWVLACPREYEAKIFLGNRDPETWNGMAHLPVPAKLICGDPALGEAPSLTGEAVAAESGLDYEAVAGTGHFLQIEKPHECIRAMESFLVRNGLRA